MYKSSRKLLSFFIISILSFGFDQLTKLWVDRYVNLNESIEVIKNFLYLTYVQNYGVVFGMFQESQYVFLATSIAGLAIIAAVVLYIYYNIDKFSYTKVMAYALIFGGGLGNSWDRFYLGYVIDFIDFSGIWQFIFNFADAFVCIAVGMLILDSYLSKETK